MPFDPITAVSELVNTVLGRVLPDKSQQAAAQAALQTAEIQANVQAIVAQLQVDAAEASNKSTFVAGWRPFVGWICGSAFAYGFIIQPLLQTLLVAFHSTFDPAKLPAVNFSEMAPVLLGMLGLGALRSYDKQNGNGNGH